MAGPDGTGDDPETAGGAGIIDVPPGGVPGAPAAGGSGGSGGAGGSAGGGSSGSGGGTGVEPMLASLLGPDGLDDLRLVMPALVTSFGGVAMAMAFLAFGKRRRDERPTDTDAALAAAAAIGSASLASAVLIERDAFGQPVPAVAQVPIDAESLLPRWRRPSLLEARKADPVRMTAPVVNLTFDHGLVGPLDGHERRRIRYAVVRLLDSPDELLAADIGTLDQGDEVQLLERSGVYWFVLCPDGRQGWVHKMVLGEVIGGGPELPGPAERATAARTSGSDTLAARLASADSSFDGPVVGGSAPPGHDPTMPAPAWSLRGATATDAGQDIDDDVLQAFLDSRGIR
jgi:hypothetical protein